MRAQPGSRFNLSTDEFQHGYFKSLKGIVHFYNTRDAKPPCLSPFTTKAEALAQDCWPSPEVPLNVNRKEMGNLAAALIMVANDPNTLEFFRRLNTLEGKVSADGSFDPVEALLTVIDSYKNKRIPQARMQVELCGKTVKAVMLWNHGSDFPKYWTKNTLRAADYQSFIRELKRIKAIHDARDL